MPSWIDRWNRFWFPCTSTLNLAACRIIAVAAQLLWFTAPLDHHINRLSKNPAFIDPQPIIRAISAVVPRDLLFTPSIFPALYWATVAAGFAALLGLLTRISVFAFALGTWFLVSHEYSYADVHHPEALFAIFLVLLALSPSGKSLALDAIIRRRRTGSTTQEPPRADTAIWPLKLTQLLLAMTYFSTGITKLLSGGLTWMNGYTLQIYTFRDALARDLPLGIWLSQQYFLAVVLSVLTVLFEIFYFASLLRPRTAPFFFVGAIFFHIGLFATAGHPFFEHILLNALLLVFLDPDWFPSQWKKLVARLSGPVPPRKRTLAG